MMHGPTNVRDRLKFRFSISSDLFSVEF